MGSAEFFWNQLERARAYLDLDRPQAAIREVSLALVNQPHSADALQLLGLCHLRLEERKPAIDALTRAIAIEPEDAHGHYLLGFAYADQVDDEKGDAQKAAAASARAEASYREALRLSPTEPVYLRALAELLVDRKGSPRHAEELAEALVSARRAVELGSERASNHITLGYVASATGDRVLARACYEAALRIEPNNALALNNLGCVDLAQGRPMEARARFREALRIDPKKQVAHENLKLVDPGQRPKEIYLRYPAFERQLIVEIWEHVLWNRKAPSSAQVHAARTARVSPPLSPKAFFKNYFMPRPVKDDPRLHAAALLLATEFRPLPAVLLRMPQLLGVLGLSVSLLRLGPAGAAVTLAATSATYLLKRKPIRRRYDVYHEELHTIAGRWQALYDDWLAGTIERQQRDGGMDRLLDEFAQFVEALREKLHAEESPLDEDG